MEAVAQWPVHSAQRMADAAEEPPAAEQEPEPTEAAEEPAEEPADAEAAAEAPVEEAAPEERTLARQSSNVIRLVVSPALEAMRQ